MTTGERIKKLRKALGLSTDELGAMISKDRSTIYRYERGDIEYATVDVIPRLAKALQTTPQHLLGWDNKPAYYWVDPSRAMELSELAEQWYSFTGAHRWTQKEFELFAAQAKYTMRINGTDEYEARETCTSAKRCTTCGITEGSALGHSNNVICTRCGIKQFQTKYYTGEGPGSITGITLPNGLYNIGTANVGNDLFSVWLSTGSGGYGYPIATRFGSGKNIYQLRVTDALKVQNGVFNISTAGAWTVAIEAVGN